jgi:hypothetical protein
MPACRETQHANAVGIDMEVRRMKPYEANRASAIEQRSRKQGITPDSILEHEYRYTLHREPCRGLSALEHPRQVDIATAGHDDDGSPIRADRRLESGERGGLGGGIARCTGCAAAPQPVSGRLTQRVRERRIGLERTVAGDGRGNGTAGCLRVSRCHIRRGCHDQCQHREQPHQYCRRVRKRVRASVVSAITGP